MPIDVARAMIDEAAKANPTLATLIVLAGRYRRARGELCALAVGGHVDIDAGTLRIKAAIGETNVVYEKDTKTHQHRNGHAVVVRRSTRCSTTGTATPRRARCAASS